MGYLGYLGWRHFGEGCGRGDVAVWCGVVEIRS